MRDFRADSKRCATCAWWEGERRADRIPPRVQPPSHASQGRCRSPHSWWAGRLRAAESQCLFWDAWGTEAVSGPPMTAWPVLRVEPLEFRYNRETGDTNAFQVAPAPDQAERLAALALLQHQPLPDPPGAPRG